MNIIDLILNDPNIADEFKLACVLGSIHDRGSQRWREVLEEETGPDPLWDDEGDDE